MDGLREAKTESISNIMQNHQELWEQLNENMRETDRNIAECNRMHEMAQNSLNELNAMLDSMI